jgi:diguanylate cyclase (GGDEF)-like protein
MFSAEALIEPRLMAAAAAAVIAGLLFLLYVNRRRGYLLLWMAGWVLMAAGMMVLGDEGSVSGNLARFAGLFQALHVASALAFALSATSMDGAPSWTRRHGAGALALLGLCLVLGTPLAGGGGLVPGYLVAATALGVSGARYAQIARREHFAGAGLLALGFATAAASNLWMVRAVTLGSSETVLRLMAVGFVAYAIVTLGMHLLIFEDTTRELRLSNTRLEAAREQLRQLALTDPLTGAYNRRFFDEIIGRELERHRRTAEPLAIVFMDIDRFKTVNDVHGHAVGDSLLRDVAEFLKRKLRETDYVFRWGGDEFLVVMSCPASAAATRMRTLKTEYEAAPLVSALGNGVGLSIGCAEAPPGTKEIDAVIAAADANMYLQKRPAAV